MRKPPVAFAVSFLLSLAFTWVSFYRFGFTTLISTQPFEAIAFFGLVDMLFTLVTVAVFFGVFYFLGDRYKMKALKSTVLALFIGVAFGSALFNLIEMSSLSSSLFGAYITYSASASFGGIFEFFLPSITALLFVELRQNRSANAQKP